VLHDDLFVCDSGVSVFHDADHFLVSKDDGDFSCFDSTLGGMLGDLSSLGLDDSNLGSAY